MLKLSIATLGIGLVGYALSPQADDRAMNLRRVECSTLTIFAPAERLTDEELCRAHGGLAKAGAAPSESGLVILVRNRPAGGFEGLGDIR
ncbi:hypothetical protein [Polymorphum gilvum]|uniref:Antitermination protein n=1 Tax=Polymorphum gilvum (strain LMG 25793 / CGMCC 1.9160 / SL003B-26A1) TaxID=991905 RepID=F2J475_POLGS|nr:hypothetical protein [Polymorphum gilvum]ADZ70001.1 hypothetical protein SL003B_1573 [Polymorphum gilvum SL003B-26A1]